MLSAAPTVPVVLLRIRLSRSLSSATLLRLPLLGTSLKPVFTLSSNCPSCTLSCTTVSHAPSTAKWSAIAPVKTERSGPHLHDSPAVPKTKLDPVPNAVKLDLYVGVWMSENKHSNWKTFSRWQISEILRFINVSILVWLWYKWNVVTLHWPSLRLNLSFCSD